MTSNHVKMGKDLERINERIGANKKALQKPEIKAEELQAAIHSVMQTKQRLIHQQKLRKP